MRSFSLAAAGNLCIRQGRIPDIRSGLLERPLPLGLDAQTERWAVIRIGNASYKEIAARLLKDFEVLQRDLWIK